MVWKIIKATLRQLYREFTFLCPEPVFTILVRCMPRAVTEFVDAASQQTGGKAVVVGESFGGMLALRLGQLR